MRQTSRAVALLLALESASAVNRAIVLNLPSGTASDPITVNPFNASAASLVTTTQQLNSRTAPFSSIPASAILVTQASSAKWAVAVPQKARAITDLASSLSVPGSGCMACLNGGAVWCSRTYAYLETSTTYMYEATASTAAFMGGSTGELIQKSELLQQGGLALDGGACCETKVLFSTFIGTLAVPAATYTVPDNTASATTGITMVDQACPAIAGATFVTGPPILWDVSAAKIDDTKTAWSSWWCSNGLYKRVTTATTVVQLNSQQIIPQGTNKRLELAQMGCPQKALACGQDETKPEAFAAELTAVLQTKDYVMALTGFSVNDKCTWVVWSALAAPTFTMMDSTATGKFGLASGAYSIHNMEYTVAAANWDPKMQSLQMTATDAAGQQQMAPALSFSNYVPLFWMPAEQFASLRTWYGQGSTAADDVTGMSSNWMSPGQAPIINTSAVSLQLALVKSQLYGNVANVPMSGNVVSTTTDALSADQNYGTYNSIKFDLRQMRYFPAKVAQTVWASGSALAGQYTTALGTYNTAKTTWDAYVAILEKNAKQDAFAALFSPPKAPTVPPLPNSPWVPANYSGYVRATAEQVAGYQASSTVPTLVASPTAQQFWTSLAAAQTSGGWGSFTATIFTYRNGWGKSFGTIGYSGDADREAMSDVWNYKWTCVAATVGPSTPSTTSQCADTYTATAGQVAGAGADTAANAVKMITAVSLWANSNVDGSGNAYSENDWAKNGLKLTFTGSAWKSGIVGLTAIAAGTAPVAAKSLSGIAGAQALAATSAAALAVAAALY